MISLFQDQNYQHFMFLKVYTFLLLVSFSSSGHILDSIPNFDPPKITIRPCYLNQPTAKEIE